MSLGEDHQAFIAPELGFIWHDETRLHHFKDEIVKIATGWGRPSSKLKTFLRPTDHIPAADFHWKPLETITFYSQKYPLKASNFMALRTLIS